MKIGYTEQIESILYQFIGREIFFVTKKKKTKKKEHTFSWLSIRGCNRYKQNLSIHLEGKCRGGKEHTFSCLSIRGGPRYFYPPKMVFSTS